MSFSENPLQSSIAPSVCREDNVSIEAETVDERLVSRTSSANSTYRSYERHYSESSRIPDVKFPRCTEALGSESCDDNQETIFTRRASWDGVSKSAMSEDSNVLHVPAWGKQVGSCIEQQEQREIVDDTEDPSSADSHSQLPHKAREDTLASLIVSPPKTIRKLSGTSKERRFPPPISSIYPSPDSTHVYLRQFKGDGRFVLQEVKIPCQNVLRASRENGRLTLRLVNYEKSEESSAPFKEFERTTLDATIQERTTDHIPAIAERGFNEDRTGKARRREDTRTPMGELEFNGGNKPKRLILCVDGSLTNGGAKISSRHSSETAAEERRSTSDFNAINTEYSVMEANLETSPARVSITYGPANATTSTTDQRSVREQYDPGLVPPLVVF